jgi:hypothetical protein
LKLEPRLKQALENQVRRDTVEAGAKTQAGTGESGAASPAVTDTVSSVGDAGGHDGSERGGSVADGVSDTPPSLLS